MTRTLRVTNSVMTLTRLSGSSSSGDVGVALALDAVCGVAHREWAALGPQGSALVRAFGVEVAAGLGGSRVSARFQS